MADGQMTPADLAAVTNGMDGNNCWWLIILFLIICWGGNGFGWGGNAANGTATATDAAIAAQGGYVTNAQLNDALRLQEIQQGQRGITDAVTASEQRLTANQTSLLANQAANAQAMQSCCAETKYASAQNTASINANTTAQTQKVLDALAADKADRQAQRINDLQQQLNAAQYQNALQQATFGTVKYPTMSAYNSGMNPFCNCGQCCNA